MEQQYDAAWRKQGDTLKGGRALRPYVSSQPARWVQAWRGPRPLRLGYLIKAFPNA